MTIPAGWPRDWRKVRAGIEAVPGTVVAGDVIRVWHAPWTNVWTQVLAAESHREGPISLVSFAQATYASPVVWSGPGDGRGRAYAPLLAPSVHPTIAHHVPPLPPPFVRVVVEDRGRDGSRARRTVVVVPEWVMPYWLAFAPGGPSPVDVVRFTRLLGAPQDIRETARAALGVSNATFVATIRGIFPLSLDP